MITGAHVQEGPSIGAAGDTRAWDVRAGKLIWTFHAVPRPGETGSETWQGDDWKNRSGASSTRRGLAASRRFAPDYTAKWNPFSEFTKP